MGRLDGNIVSSASSRRHSQPVKKCRFLFVNRAGIAKLEQRLAQGLHVEGTGVRASAGVVSKRHLNLFIWR
jgi:hypothetical protein